MAFRPPLLPGQLSNLNDHLPVSSQFISTQVLSSNCILMRTGAQPKLGANHNSDFAVPLPKG
jgi:hypothetical protein